MNKPHKHAKLIKAWADGEELEFNNENNLGWLPVLPSHCWSNDTSYRIKPAAPKWPETTMNSDALLRVYYKSVGHSAGEGMAAVANAALAHALETGQVVLPK